MLAMPDEWPFFLKRVEHTKVGIVQTVSGTDRKFHTVDHDRQIGASLLRSCQTLTDDFNLNSTSS
jgi:hypothetical protein